LAAAARCSGFRRSDVVTGVTLPVDGGIAGVLASLRVGLTDGEAV